jgi:hydrogenase small subunit
VQRDSTSKRNPACQAVAPRQFSRRAFMKGTLASVGVLSLKLSGCGDSTAGQSFAASGRPQQAPQTDIRMPVVWIETGVCTGCAEALLDCTDPAADSLLSTVRLEFQETLMDLSGAAAIAQLDSVVQANVGRYALIVDGAIPTGEFARLTSLGTGADGQELTAEHLVKRLAGGATAVVALGTCAAWGGIPASGANPYRHAPVAAVTGAGVVRLPGCPPHGQWIAGTLATLLASAPLDLDAQSRPRAYYGKVVHETCPRKPYFKNDAFASVPGDPERCLFELGCRGPVAPGDCASRLWNGQSSCIGANYPCRGCTEQGFPDAGAKSG